MCLTLTCSARWAGKPAVSNIVRAMLYAVCKANIHNPATSASTIRWFRKLCWLIAVHS